jgi:hypothetical protein
MRSARSVPSFCRGRIPQFLPALRAGWVGGDEWRAPFERYAADIIAIAAAKKEAQLERRFHGLPG